MANKAKGNANANPKPAKPTVSGQAPSVNVPASSEPSIGPVHENETMANVSAIKKMPPKFRMPDLVLILLAKPPGNVISKYPKKEIAKTTKTAKKPIFNQILVDILFKISGLGLFRKI